jgi:hypothetical protein
MKILPPSMDGTYAIALGAGAATVCALLATAGCSAGCSAVGGFTFMAMGSPPDAACMLVNLRFFAVFAPTSVPRGDSRPTTTSGSAESAARAAALALPSASTAVRIFCSFDTSL